MDSEKKELSGTEFLRVALFAHSSRMVNGKLLFEPFVPSPVNNVYPDNPASPNAQARLIGIQTTAAAEPHNPEKWWRSEGFWKIVFVAGCIGLVILAFIAIFWIGTKWDQLQVAWDFQRTYQGYQTNVRQTPLSVLHTRVDQSLFLEILGSEQMPVRRTLVYQGLGRSPEGQPCAWFKSLYRFEEQDHQFTQCVVLNQTSPEGESQVYGDLNLNNDYGIHATLKILKADKDEIIYTIEPEPLRHS